MFGAGKVPGWAYGSGDEGKVVAAIVKVQFGALQCNYNRCSRRS
jgi:hypothetical protein